MIFGGIQIIKSRRLLIVTLFIFLAFGSILYSGQCVFAQTGQTDQTAAKLQVANSAVEQAFNAVLGSEKAGANVTGLLTLLNVAAGDLAQAENSYHAGDSNKAMAQVGIVTTIAQQVTTSAQNAKQTALVSGEYTFWFTIAFSVIAASALILVLFLVWRRFKRGYMEKIPSLRPEVAENET